MADCTSLKSIWKAYTFVIPKWTAAPIEPTPVQLLKHIRSDDKGELWQVHCVRTGKTIESWINPDSKIVEVETIFYDHVNHLKRIGSPPSTVANSNSCSIYSIRRMPFGTVWVDMLSDEWLPVYNRRIMCRTNGRQMRHPSPEMASFRLVSLKGLPVEDVPVRYLDWLLSEPLMPDGRRLVLYGSLRQAVVKFLSRPDNEELLNRMFPIEKDDSYEPVFLAQFQPTQYIRPKDEERITRIIDIDDELPEGWVVVSDVENCKKRVLEINSERPPMTKTRAWRMIADLFIYFESDPQVDEVKVFNWSEVADACRVVGPHVAEKLRTAMRDQQTRLQERTEQHLVQLELSERFDRLWKNKLKTAKATMTRKIRKALCK